MEKFTSANETQPRHSIFFTIEIFEKIDFKKMKKLSISRYKTELRYIFLIALTIVFFAILFNSFNISKIAIYINEIPLEALSLSFALLVLNMLLSSIRYHILLKRLGVRKSLLESFHDNTISIVCGVVAFNFFGQGLSRAAMNGRAEWAPTMAFLTTGIERASTLIVLIISACVGAVWLFEGISLDFAKSGYQFLLLFYLIVVALAVFWVGLRREDRATCQRTVRTNFVLFFEMLVITKLMIVAMGCAYVSIAWPLARDVGILDLSAMAAIVMFVSSLPISFSGWGIRELSASYVFISLGQSPEAGLSMGILIGLLSLFAIFGLALLLTLLKKHRARKREKIASLPDTVSTDLTSAITVFLPVAAVAAILFQVFLPTNSGVVNVNLADPLVIIGAIITIIHLVRDKYGYNLFWSHWFGPSLLLATVVIVCGFLYSWANYGEIINWALYNRLFGWLVLLSYFLTGLMIHLNGGWRGVKLVYRSYIAACAFTVLTNLAILLASNLLRIEIQGYWVYSGIYGMASNPNAFGFQLLVALVIGVSGISLWKKRKYLETDTLLLAIVVAGIFFSQSRAAFISLGCLFVAFYWLNISLKKLARIIMFAGSIVVLYYGASELFDIIANMGSGSGSSSSGEKISRFFRLNSLVEVQSDRMLSITDGLKMWKNNLIFGAGLGAFIYEQVQKTGIPLVIHSIYLWLLAEFGVAGFLAFMGIPASLAYGLWKQQIKTPEWAKHTIIGIFMIMGVTGLVHDMAYQRVFWFFLGLASANVGFFCRKSRSS